MFDLGWILLVRGPVVLLLFCGVVYLLRFKADKLFAVMVTWDLTRVLHWALLVILCKVWDFLEKLIVRVCT